MKKVIRGGTVVTASESGAGRRPDRRRDDRRRRLVRRRGRRADRRLRLLRAAGPDRQPHPPLDAVRRHLEHRRLRHRHPGGRGRRHDLPRRLRPADAPGGLRSSLEEWQGRAEGCAHVDYGFHMAITSADEGDDRRHGRDGRGGRLDVQGLPGLQGRPDGHGRPVPGRARAARARPAGSSMVHCRERLRDRPSGAEGAGRRQHRPDLPRAHPPGGARGRGHGRAPSASPSTPAAPVFIVHVTCRERGRGDHRAPRTRRRRPTARPACSTSSTRRTTCAGPTSRAPATSARRRCGRRPTRPHLWDALASTTCRSSRPTTARSTTSRSGSAWTTSRRSRTAWP